jgi:hypothetical protein
MFRRRDTGQVHNAGDRFQASKLDAISSRVILKEMSIDSNHCFVACAKAGCEYRPAGSPAAPVVAVANNRHFVTDQTQQ